MEVVVPPQVDLAVRGRAGRVRVAGRRAVLDGAQEGRSDRSHTREDRIGRGCRIVEMEGLRVVARREFDRLVAGDFIPAKTLDLANDIVIERAHEAVSYTLKRNSRTSPS